MSKRDATTRKGAHEPKLVALNDRELDSVAGGDIHFTKTTDTASPNLFIGCSGAGKHVGS